MDDALPSAPAAAAGPRAVFAIVSLGVVLATLDQFVVNVAFDAIGRSLHGGIATLSWVLNGYSIVFAALLVPAGRLADRSGHKSGYLLGVTVFTIASAACAAAPDVAVLVAARLVQAAGAAFLVPSSLALLLAAFPAERRAGAVAGWTAVTGFSAAVGPVLGGLLVAASWRWIFLVNLPVGAIAVLGAQRVLPSVRERPTPLPDLAGAALLALGISALALGLVEAPEWGWGSPRIGGSFALAAVALAAFVRRSRRHRAPVVELSLLGVPRFAIATLAITIYSAAFAAMLLAVILWAQTAWGWSALRTGVLFAPGPLMVPLLSGFGVRIASRIGAGVTAAAGCAVFACAAAVAIAGETLEPRYVLTFLPTALLMGTGVALALPTLVAAGSRSLPSHRFATGSGVLNMARQIGFTLGVAILVAVLGTPGRGQHQLASFRHGWIAVAAIAAAAAAASSMLLATRQA